MMYLWGSYNQKYDKFL